MCGIVGVMSTRGNPLSIGAQTLARMRDRLAHRGPDGSGEWWSPRRDAALGHRRLAVIEPPPSTSGAQPMISACGGCALVYNGELYNDGEIRASLARDGVEFRTRCDTETVLLALKQWGAAALARFRGMFALGFYDSRAHTLLLARDPLGIKPLYHAVTPRGEFAFASEPTALLEHPDIPARPDLITLSAYLTTIRTTLGERTMYAGISVLEPASWMLVRDDGGTLALSRGAYWQGPEVQREDAERAARAVRIAMGESVAVHLRSDVPACCLLSGGLDSTVITHEATARGLGAGTRTYCSGAPGGTGDDLEFARAAAASLGTVHTEAPITQTLFEEQLRDMVERNGVPMGTPNEVAIREVCRRLRADGQVVALSGEGADELFGGYDLALRGAAQALAQGMSGGAAHLAAAAWTPVEAKPAVLLEHVWRGVESDEHLRSWYDSAWTSCIREVGALGTPTDAFLRMQRRINLVGLLQRLDTSAMLEGVEGRTPFADVRIAELAESLPAVVKVDLDSPGTAAATKVPLRSAYADALPHAILARPKASFPLPFAEWLGPFAGVVRRSAFLRGVLRPEAIALAADDPSRNWRLAWPLVNLALWGRRWE